MAVTYRDVLAVREFRALFVANGLSVLGDQVTRIAVALLVFERSGSAFAASATYACSYLTWLLGGPVLTAYADRYPRREVMVACDLLRAGLVALLVVPGLPLWAVFAVLLVTGALAPPFDGARSAMTADILDGDLYVSANGLQGTVRELGQVIGFLAGGALVALISVQGALLVDAATFVLSAVAVRFVVERRPSHRDGEAPLGLLAETREGFLVVARSRELLRLLVYGALGMAAVIAPEGLAVPVTEALGGGAVATGILTASVPAGFTIGSLLLLRIPAARRQRLLGPLIALSALPLLATPLAEHLVVVFVLWTLSGVASSMQIIANAAYVVATPPALRARAFGVAGTCLMAVQGLVLLGAGAAAEVLDPRTVVALVALASLLLLPLVSLMSPGGKHAAQGIGRTGRGSGG